MNPERKRVTTERAGEGRNKYQKLDIPSSNTGDESAAQKEQNDYQDTIRHMIIETRDYAAALDLPCFTHVKL